MIHNKFMRNVFSDNQLILMMNHTHWFKMRRQMNFDVIIAENISHKGHDIFTSTLIYASTFDKKCSNQHISSERKLCFFYQFL